MSNAKFRCRTCREYFPQPPAYMVGISWFCSESCMKARTGAERYLAARKAKDPAYAREYKRARSGLQRNRVKQTVRKRVLDRDRRRCKWCGTAWFEVHHINYLSQGGPNEDWNLICLCDRHHSEVHSDKKKWQPVLRGIIWMRYVEGRSFTVPQFLRYLETL